MRLRLLEPAGCERRFRAGSSMGRRSSVGKAISFSAGRRECKQNTTSHGRWNTVPPGFWFDAVLGGVELPRNRFTSSPLKLSVRRPQSRTDMRVSGGGTYSPREPRVSAMKTRTISRRQSWAIPRRFSRITCHHASVSKCGQKTSGRNGLTSSVR